MQTLTADKNALVFAADAATANSRTAARGSRSRLWIGRVLSGLCTLALLFDSVVKLLRLAPAVEGTIQVGYPPTVIVPLGLVLLGCVALYALPRTAVVGAVLLTGYLGGAVATHVRIGDPLFSHVLAPIYVAVLAWGGLYLRDGRVRALIGPRRG